MMATPTTTPRRTTDGDHAAATASPNGSSGNRSVLDLARPDRDDDARDVPPPRRRRLTRVLIPLLVLLATVGLLLYASWEQILPATPVRVTPVIVKTVQGQQTGTVTVQAPGWVEPAPHPYYASALANGIVEEVTVLEGERVTAGQVVARMVDDDARLALAATEAAVEQRKAELAAAEAELRAAEKNIEHLVAPRRAVANAEARVAEIDASLMQLEATLLAEQSKLAEIQDEFDRKSELVESRAVSEADVRRLELRVEAQKASIEATRARREILQAQRRQAQADLEAATENLDLLIEERQRVDLATAAVAERQAMLRAAESNRDEAALRLERMLVRSPVDGIVMIRLAAPGSKLTREGGEHSAHAVHIYKPEHLQVRVDVPLADAARVGVGQEAEIVVEVLPDSVFNGRVTRVVHEADIAKNTMEVKVAIAEPTPELKPEMLARVRFIGRSEATGEEPELRARVFAPADLLASTGDGGAASALVVGKVQDGRGRVERRSLSLGGTVIEGWREVVSGLQPGDLLVANPPATLEPGDRVEVLGETNLQPQTGDL